MRKFTASANAVAAIFLALSSYAYAANAAQPSGNLNGATVSITAPMTGTVTISNGTIQCPAGMSPATLDTGSTINGITFTGTTACLTTVKGASNITIENCPAIPGFYTSVGSSDNNVTITGNHFANGSRGDFIDNNPCGNSWVVTQNVFTCDGKTVVEAAHFVNGAPTGLNISNNTITGSCRNPIEVQVQAINGVCSGNYIHKPNLQNGVQASIGISWACGPSAVNGGVAAPGATFSTGCQITGNVIDNSDGQYPVPITNAWSQLQGIEWMGNNGTVGGNWIRNTGFNAYTWTAGFVSKGNTWIGYTGPQPWNGEPGMTGPTPPTIQGDMSYALGAPNIPPMPAAGAPGAMTPTSPPIPPVQTLTCVQNGDGTVSITAPTPISTITVSPSTANPLYPPVTLPFPIASATCKIGNVPANWFITATSGSLTGPPIQVLGGPAVPPAAWGPTLLLPVTPPPVKPTLVTTSVTTVTTGFYTDGSTTVSTATATTKPQP